MGAYERMIEQAQELASVNPESAQAYALIAIADRLDRLCEVASRRGERR